MARFNIWKEYEKAAKYIAKFDQLHMNRKEDDILVSNGHFLVKVNAGIYNEFFRTVSPRYIELKDGDQVTANDRKQLPKESRIELFGCIPKDNYSSYHVNVTRFILEGNDDVKADLRVCFVNGSTMYINNEYYNALKVFFRSEKISNGVKSGIYSDFIEDTAAFILPVNANQANNGRFQVIDTLENTNRMSA